MDSSSKKMFAAFCLLLLLSCRTANQTTFTSKQFAPQEQALKLEIIVNNNYPIKTVIEVINTARIFEWSVFNNISDYGTFKVIANLKNISQREMNLLQMELQQLPNIIQVTLSKN